MRNFYIISCVDKNEHVNYTIIITATRLTNIAKEAFYVRIIRQS